MDDDKPAREDGQNSPERREEDEEEEHTSTESNEMMIDQEKSSGSSSFQVSDEDEATATKKQAIIDACEHRDIARLVALAESKGGYLSDDLRQQAWPVLLGLPLPGSAGPDSATTNDDAASGSGEGSGSWKELERHRDEDQVQLDVNRAFVYYPKHASEAEEERQKRELSDVIVEVLRRYPYLCYFQGYHDICQVFLLVLGPSAPRRPQQQQQQQLAQQNQKPGQQAAVVVAAVSRLSALRIRDFMLPTIDAAVQQLRLLPDVLRAADPALWRHLSQTQPFFALSGTLTMYAHDVQSLGEIARLFDVLLAREPAFSVYLFAAIVRGRRAELFDTPADEPEMLHSILSKLPRDLDLDALIAAAAALADAHPPESLPSWRALSPASVLRTARPVEACAAQSMADGERFFRRQVAELRLAQRRKRQRELVARALWKYRGPLRALGLAIFVGVVAVWLRRSPAASTFAASPFSYVQSVLHRLWS